MTGCRGAHDETHIGLAVHARIIDADIDEVRAFLDLFSSIASFVSESAASIASRKRLDPFAFVRSPTIRERALLHEGHEAVERCCYRARETSNHVARLAKDSEHRATAAAR